jgi:hypothetical protein
VVVARRGLALNVVELGTRSTEAKRTENKELRARAGEVPISEYEARIKTP